jgi:acetyl esterase
MQATFKSTALAIAVASALAACGSMRSADNSSAATPSSGTATATATASGSAAGMSGKPNAQMQQVLNELQALGAKPLHTLSVEQARTGPTPADAVKQVLQKQGKSAEPMAVANTADGAINGPAGPIPARIYWPEGMTEQSPPMPVVLYIHGGGWVIADLDTYDATPRALANGAKAIVVSTHYRQAPEHQFPAAHDDTWTAYQWVLANAHRFGGDPKRVAVAGESAGGNMAAAIALRARDEKVQPPVHQLLVYPVADAAVNSPSEQQNEQAAPLSTPDLPWFYTKYLGQQADTSNRYFSIRNADVAGVAPATVITAQIDPLRSEGEAYAEKLKSAGVPVQLKNYDGVTHEFFGMGAVVDQAKDAMQYGTQALQGGWAGR